MKNTNISKRATSLQAETGDFDNQKENIEKNDLGVKQIRISPKEEVPDLLDSRVREIAQTQPFIYILNLSDKYPKYMDVAARNVAYDYPELFFISGLDEDDRFKDLLPIAADGIARTKPFVFFLKHLNRLDSTKKYTPIALENLAKQEPETFLNSHYARMPEFEKLKEIAINSNKNKVSSISKRNLYKSTN